MYPHERSLVQEMQGRPFVLLGVNTDDQISTAQEAIAENNLNWRSFYDGRGGSICRQFGIRAFPTIMLIDHQGVIRFDSIRKNLDEEIEHLVSTAESAGMVGEKIAPEMRTFRDKTGKHKIRAVAEAGDDQSVRLRKDDDSTIEVKRENLSKADQRYLQTVDLLPLDGTPTAQTVPDQPLRRFRDRSGRFEVQARLLEIAGDQIVLEKEDGTQIQVALGKLDPEDRDYVEQQRRQ